MMYPPGVERAIWSASESCAEEDTLCVVRRSASDTIEAATWDAASGAIWGFTGNAIYEAAEEKVG